MDAYRLALDFRVVVGVVFLYAGLSKLSHNSMPQQLELLNAIGVPSHLRGAVRLLPAIEVGLGLWLLSDWLTVASLIVVAGHVVVFLIVIIQAIRREYSGGCGCFGRSTRGVGVANIVFTSMLLMGILAALTNELTHGYKAASVFDMTIFDALIVTTLSVLGEGIYAISAEMDNFVRRINRGADA